VVVVAVGLRAAAWCTPAVAESDVYRYLWDGAVTASGEDPYVRPLAQAAAGDLSEPELRRLAEAGREVLQRANHPQYRTIYPPVSQLLFATAHRLTPFSITGLRLVLLLCDLLAVLGVVGLLRRGGLPWSWACVWLWNPLVVFETYGLGHADVALAPCLLLLAWGLDSRRPVVSGLALVVGVGIKLWPALLLPFLVTTFYRDRRGLFMALGTAGLGLAGLGLAYGAAFGTDAQAGLYAYARNWDANALAYRWLQDAGYGLARWSGGVVDGKLLARGLLGGLLLALSALLAMGPPRGRALYGALGCALLPMLLLGPTLYPWYHVPLVVLAVGASRRGPLLLWTALLPLTYLPASEGTETARRVLLHLPVWGLWLHAVVGYVVAGRRAIHA